MGDAGTYVVVVLTADIGLNSIVGKPGIEIAGFESHSPAMPEPYIQTSSKLNYAGVGAGCAGVRTEEVSVAGFPEAAAAAANANPWSDRVTGKDVQARRWSQERRANVLGNLILVGV